MRRYCGYKLQLWLLLHGPAACLLVSTPCTCAAFSHHSPPRLPLRPAGINESSFRRTAEPQLLMVLMRLLQSSSDTTFVASVTNATLLPDNTTVMVVPVDGNATTLPDSTTPLPTANATAGARGNATDAAAGEVEGEPVLLASIVAGGSEPAWMAEVVLQALK